MVHACIRPARRRGAEDYPRGPDRQFARRSSTSSPALWTAGRSARRMAKVPKMPGKNASAAERPWIMRTYSGHSSAEASNTLFRSNLAKGQTGLSVAFDLPTQLGYDPDHPLARGEVGKVGVPVSHLGDMRALFDGIPLGEMNTSMTINATAAWLLALYVALADERGVPRTALQGT